MCLRNVKLKMPIVFLFMLLNTCLEGKGSTSDYCITPYCKAENLACTSSKNMSQFCVPGSNIIDLRVYKSHILKELNTFRNKVANGYTRTLYPAARMAKMDWSNELEMFAYLYIMKCKPKAHYCMSSPEFTIIGSIYDGLSYTGSPALHPYPDLITELMTGWFEDAQYITKDLVRHLINKFARPSVRQAALLMTDRNSHVGCSGLTFVTGLNNYFRFTCAFATDNMIGAPIYNISHTAGRLCRHRDKKYKNLCALGEKYNNVHENMIGRELPSPVELLIERYFNQGNK